MFFIHKREEDCKWIVRLEASAARNEPKTDYTDCGTANQFTTEGHLLSANPAPTCPGLIIMWVKSEETSPPAPLRGREGCRGDADGGVLFASHFESHSSEPRLRGGWVAYALT
jgi:hypothetical protein